MAGAVDRTDDGVTNEQVLVVVFELITVHRINIVACIIINNKVDSHNIDFLHYVAKYNIMIQFKLLLKLIYLITKLFLDALERIIHSKQCNKIVVQFFFINDWYNFNTDQFKQMFCIECFDRFSVIMGRAFFEE